MRSTQGAAVRHSRKKKNMGVTTEEIFQNINVPKKTATTNAEFPCANNHNIFTTKLY